MQSTFRVLRAPFFTRQSLSNATLARSRSGVRQFSAALPRQDDKKSSLMDRNKMNTESNEYSKTGSDAKAAQEGTAAFDPSKTDPDSQMESSTDDTPESESQGNPLEVSPANKETSKPRDQTEGGAEKGENKSATSAKGSAKKGKQVS